MSTIISYPFTVPSNYSYDSSKIEIVGGKAQLKLVNNTGQTLNEDFADDTDFVYNNTKSEFTGGLVRQKSQMPSGGTFLATYTSSINGNMGGGTLTGTAINGATITDTRLDCTFGSSTCVTYSGTDNAELVQTGCVKLKFTPNFTGSPAAAGSLFGISKTSGDTSNLIQILKFSDSTNYFRIKDSSNNYIVNENFVWAVTSGTTYEVEANFDVTTGLSELYIDGVRVAQSTATGTRSADIAQLVVGASPSAANNIDGFIEDFIVFTTVQHTGASYTPGYTLSELEFLTTNVVTPEYPITGPGNLVSTDGFTSIEAGIPKYTAFANYGAGFNEVWYTGGAWVASNGTYAEANTASEFNAGLADWPIVESMSVDVKFGIYFEEGTTLSSVSNLELEYTDQIYPTDNPTITTNTSFASSGLNDFATTVTVTGSDAVKFTISANGQERYVTGGSAADSNGTYAESSTAAELLSDITNVITTRKQIVFPKIFLHSDDGQTTPIIDWLSITYDASILSATVGTLCNFDGLFFDKDGPIASEPVYIRPYKGFINGNVLHVYDWETLGTTDADGWLTSDIYVQTAGNFWEMKVGKQRYKFALPNQGEADFSNLVSFEVIEVE